REALANYYEFCRLMDDLADEPNQDNPQQQLDSWAGEIARIYAGAPQTPLGQRLIQDVAEFGISKDRFLLLIEGMQADLSGKTYKTFEELEWYLYRVAVIVGMATLDILGVKGPQADALSKDLGGAVQLTNIIRDVTSDAELGRVYLPMDLLEKHNLTRQDVLEGKHSDRIAFALQEVDCLVQKLYARAEHKMEALPRFKMLPCRVMGYVYFANLAKIRKTGFLFSQPVKLSKFEKLKEVFHAFVKTLFC
ncbi:MAG: squalene/phytoene synthase family protein, partial [Alphaproteobacteria bacterium]|nr:squalene/phytoene synthase family protein [Alphaproteobacteria bacterium]